MRLKITLVLILVLSIQSLCSAQNPIVLNSATFLKFPSPYEPTGQYVHPSIIKFTEPWHGYLYWMAATPYPGMDSSKENPVILAGNNGIDWEIKTIVDQKGLTEPYNSDPCLVYDGQSLWVYWRYLGAQPALQQIYRAKSADGVTWGEKELVLEGERESMCSPSITIQAGKWALYYSDPDGRIYRRNSENGLIWSEKVPQTLFLSDNEDFVFVTKKNAHVEVRTKADGGLLMIVMGDAPKHGKNLYLFHGSPDSADWFGSGEPLIAVGQGAWDSYSLYKTSFLVDESTDKTGSQTKLRIWYSAYRMNPVVFHIGYTETLMERWSYTYNLEASPWRFVEQGMQFVGYPNASGMAFVDKNLPNGLVQTEFKPLAGTINGGLIFRYKSKNNLASFTLEGNKAFLRVEAGGKREERIAELTEPLVINTTYQLKLVVTNKVYKAFLNNKLILQLVSNLDLESGSPGLIAAGGDFSFKNILIR